MNEEIATPKQKKALLMWFMKNFQLARREIYWLINYLAQHEAMLKHMQVVEQAEDTPRGIVINTEPNDSENSFSFIKNGTEVADYEQAFHELRMHWHEDFYITLNFPNSWQNSLYIDVVEDNPFASWNSQIDEIDKVVIDDALNGILLKAAMKNAELAVNQALDDQDMKAFKKHVKLYKKYELLYQQFESVHTMM